MKDEVKNALTKGIDEILWEEWDPIGLKYFHGPRNEYSMYVQNILEQTLLTSDPIKIADLLHYIEQNRMELEGNYEKCIIVAKKIMALKYD